MLIEYEYYSNQMESMLGTTIEKRKEKLNNQIERVLEEKRENKINLEDVKKLCVYMYFYVIEEYKNNKQFLYDGDYDAYGLEIYQTADSCIRNYDFRSDFLSYFRTSWEKKCSSIRGNIAIEKKQVHVPDPDVRKLRSLIRYLKIHKIFFSPTLHTELAAEVMQVPLEKAREIINMHFMQTGAFVIVNDEGEESSIFETIPDENVSAEEIQIRKENWNKVMKQIEEGYDQIKPEPESYVKDVFTCDIAEVLLYYDEKYSYQYSFINISKMNKILSIETIPNRKEIAIEHGILQQSLSRAYSNAVNKIKDYWRKKNQSNLQQEQK